MMFSAYILSGIYNYLIIAILYIIIEWLICRFYIKNNIKVKAGFIIGWQVLAILMVIIFSITGSGGLHDIGHYGSQIITMDKIGLIPFKWGIENMFGLVANAIMFVPFGMLLPLLFEDGTDLKNTLLTGFIFSMLIEISQLFNHRATDIDDVIMNTLGTLIGYGLYCLCLRKVKIFKVKNKGNRMCIKHSPMLSMLIIFIAYFLIGGYLVRIFWTVLYK